MATSEKNLIKVKINNIELKGNLIIPENPIGIILFAHGSGSSRLSPRNRFVAEELQKHSLATFLIDLLTEQEEQEEYYTAALRFDIPMLAKRLCELTDWLKKNKTTEHLPLGYFGASTGAAAALVAAASKVKQVNAIVSRGGRPDLAGKALPKVRAATLLIVGGNDGPVIDMNKEAQAELVCENKLVIIPGASHLFEEPGTLEQAAKLAVDWFTHHL